MFFDVLTQDALTDAAAAAAAATTTTTTTATTTSQHLMTSCDVTSCHDNTPSVQLSLADDSGMYSDSSCNTSVTCPVITLSTDSELADVGESCTTAKLPLQFDWLPTIQSLSSLANRSSDLLTLQSLDVNDNCLKHDSSSEGQVLDESYLTDDSAISDDNQMGDLMSGGTVHSLLLSPVSTPRFPLPEFMARVDGP